MTDRTAADLPLGVACEIERLAPTSLSQRALWILCQALSDDSVYNEAHVVRIRGLLDVDALAKALDEVVRRHEALRTCFRVVNGEPMQAISAETRLPLEVVELSAVAEQEREAEARRRAQYEVRAPFDLERGPLTRVQLLRMARDEHWLVVTRHHLNGDGTSSVILARELSVLYNAYQAGRAPALPALPAQYADYALRQCASANGCWGRKHKTSLLIGSKPSRTCPRSNSRRTDRGRRCRAAAGDGSCSSSKRPSRLR